jgi:hypothetical protein
VRNLYEIVHVVSFVFQPFCAINRSVKDDFGERGNIMEKPRFRPGDNVLYLVKATGEMQLGTIAMSIMIPVSSEGADVEGIASSRKSVFGYTLVGLFGVFLESELKEP